MSSAEYLKLLITRNVVTYIAEDTGIDIKTAMERFYNSAIFDKLQDTDTGLYTESASYVYELFKDGVNFATEKRNIGEWKCETVD